MNQGNLGLVDEIYATDYVERTGLPGVPTTRDGVKQTVKALRTAFPDLHYTMMTRSSGDRIVHRLTGSGTGVTFRVCPQRASEPRGPRSTSGRSPMGA